MVYSPCMVANFGLFQNAVIFRILGVFWSLFLHTTTLMWSYNSFFAPFWHFSFLTQTYHLLWAIAHASWPILAIFKMLSLFEYQVFLEQFFPHNSFNVVEQCSFAPFWQFLFLIQTDHFAWAIAHASWHILAIFKIQSFFEYQVLFGAVSCTQQL